MLYNESDLIEALHTQTGFRRAQVKCLWFAFEYGIVDAALLVAAGLATDTANVSNKHMIRAPLRQGWLEPNGVLVPATTRPFAQHRLTSSARTRMSNILKDVHRKRATTELRIQQENSARA